MSLQVIRNIKFGVDTLGSVSDRTKEDLAFVLKRFESYFDRLWTFSYDSRYNAYMLFIFLVLEDFLSPDDEEIREAVEVIWKV